MKYIIQEKFRIPLGWRTLKTAAAVAISIFIIEQYAPSTDGLLFAVMGAFSAMEPTIKAALRSCVTQIAGVVVGVILALLMRAVTASNIVAAGVGIIFIMVLYQLARTKSSPVLPCLILITICTKPELGALTYGFARIANTAVGLVVGMVINMLVFPYDNSQKIREAMVRLDEDFILFLEDMFDGDTHLPETEEMRKRMDMMEQQLDTFADQRLLRRNRQRRVLQQLQICEDTAQDLLLQIRVLRSMDYVGKLNQENRKKLCDLGAKIAEEPPTCRYRVEDLITNYHVGKALQLREQLKSELGKKE